MGTTGLSVSIHNNNNLKPVSNRFLFSKKKKVARLPSPKQNEDRRASDPSPKQNEDPRSSDQNEGRETSTFYAVQFVGQMIWK